MRCLRNKFRCFKNSTINFSPTWKFWEFLCKILFYYLSLQQGIELFWVKNVNYFNFMLFILVHGRKVVAKLIFICLKMIIFLWANQRYHIAKDARLLSLMPTIYIWRKNPWVECICENSPTLMKRKKIKTYCSL